MPKRSSKDWHELFLKEPANSSNVDKTAAYVGVKRYPAYRHCNEEAAFDERRDAAMKWQTEFAEVTDGVP